MERNQTKYAMGPPQSKAYRKHGALRVEKETISVTPLFKQRAGGNKHTADLRTGKVLGLSRQTKDEAAVTKARNGKSHGTNAQLLKNKSNRHPLAVAFQESTNDYRRHIYEKASRGINGTLESLLQTVSEFPLQSPIAPTTPSRPANNTGKTTIPEVYDKLSSKLCRPLSSYNIRASKQNGQEQKEISFGDYMDAFQEDTKQQQADLVKLQTKWETVVGEIWTIGADLLGEKAMQSLLFLDQQGDGEVETENGELRSSQANAESSLFVSETGPSPLKNKQGKKRVTFETPPAKAKNPQLQFLYQPSIYRNNPLPALPVLASAEIENMEGLVNELGEDEIGEMEKIERDYQSWWQKKTAKIAMALGDD